MDRETTQRLLRESIVFLCKTHLGREVHGGFEVDAIICVSRRCSDTGYNDPQPTVFKFHEHVTDEAGRAVEENVNDWLSSGSSQSLVNGLVLQSEQLEPPAVKRRKTDEQNTNPASSGYEHSGTDTVQNTECVPDLSIVKQEPGLSESGELLVAEARGNAQIEAPTDESWSIRRLCSADAVPSDVAYSRSQAETAGMKERHGSARDSKPAVALTELEKLALKPVMSSPPPLKLIPNTAEPRQSSSEDFFSRPLSRNSNSDHNSETAGDLLDDNLEDSANGIEQSTPRRCDVCGLVFADFPTFNVHCVTLHGRYACPFCALLFPCETTRERHLFEHTGEPVDDDGLVNIPAEEDDSNLFTRPAHSSVQSEFGKQPTEYWSADISESMEMEGSLVRAVNGTLYDPQMTTRRGVLSCQTLRAMAQLDPRHPFVCDVCRARFASSSALCDHCASVHHRIPCRYCGRSFSQKASMERHQRQHTGERPYQCTLCSSSYTRKENLQTHMSRMHGTQQHSSPDFICVE